MLDRLIVYMRQIHLFCFYCGEEYDDEDELFKRCAHKHIIGKKKEEFTTEENIKLDVWANSLDIKIKQRIEHSDNPDIYTGKQRIENKLEKFYQTHINKIDDEKFRCTICGKLFCGENFVRKHIGLKHSDSIKQMREKVFALLFNNI